MVACALSAENKDGSFFNSLFLRRPRAFETAGAHREMRDVVAEI